MGYRVSLFDFDLELLPLYSFNGDFLHVLQRKPYLNHLRRSQETGRGRANGGEEESKRRKQEGMATKGSEKNGNADDKTLTMLNNSLTHSR